MKYHVNNKQKKIKQSRSIRPKIVVVGKECIDDFGSFEEDNPHVLTVADKKIEGEYLGSCGDRVSGNMNSYFIIDNDSGDVSWSLEGEISIIFGKRVKDV